jgi:hypothetical protein
MSDGADKTVYVSERGLALPTEKEFTKKIMFILWLAEHGDLLFICRDMHHILGCVGELGYVYTIVREFMEHKFNIDREEYNGPILREIPVPKEKIREVGATHIFSLIPGEEGHIKNLVELLMERFFMPSLHFSNEEILAIKDIGVNWLMGMEEIAPLSRDEIERLSWQHIQNELDKVTEYGWSSIQKKHLDMYASFIYYAIL